MGALDPTHFVSHASPLATSATGVRETLVAGAVVQAVADRHGVSTGQLYTWRKQMLAMAMSGFTPVEVRQEVLPGPSSARIAEMPAPAASGDLQVVLPSVPNCGSAAR